MGTDTPVRIWDLGGLSSLRLIVTSAPKLPSCLKIKIASLTSGTEED